MKQIKELKKASSTLVAVEQQQKQEANISKTEASPTSAAAAAVMPNQSMMNYNEEIVRLNKLLSDNEANWLNEAKVNKSIKKFREEIINNSDEHFANEIEKLKIEFENDYRQKLECELNKRERRLNMSKF